VFEDPIKVRAVLAGFAGYLLLSIIAMATVVHAWMPSGLAPPELARLAETDPSLLLWQNIIGTVLTVAAGALACRLGGGLRNALALGGLLVLFGALGIYLHPGHPLWMQAVKIVAPIPLALLGGWIWMQVGRRNRRR